MPLAKAPASSHQLHSIRSDSGTRETMSLTSQTMPMTRQTMTLRTSQTMPLTHSSTCISGVVAVAWQKRELKAFVGVRPKGFV